MLTVRKILIFSCHVILRNFLFHFPPISLPPLTWALKVLTDMGHSNIRMGLCLTCEFRAHALYKDYQWALLLVLSHFSLGGVDSFGCVVCLLRLFLFSFLSFFKCSTGIMFFLKKNWKKLKGGYDFWHFFTHIHKNIFKHNIKI